MNVRIAEIHRVLKSTGSFYLHCDPTASHYLKLICDGIFVAGGATIKTKLFGKEVMPKEMRDKAQLILVG
jgi:adenine specific DNA methylase Mod